MHVIDHRECEYGSIIHHNHHLSTLKELEKYSCALEYSLVFRRTILLGSWKKFKRVKRSKGITVLDTTNEVVHSVHYS